jgi:hypothetical protein
MSTQGGALTQLIALGAADKYLTQSPSITFWRYRFSRYSNFSTESIMQSFQTSVAYGSEAQLTFNRTGDLLHNLYVVITLEGIYPDATSTSTQFPSLAVNDLCNPCFDAPDTNALNCCTYPQEIPSYTGIAPSSAKTTSLDGTQQYWCHYVNAIGQYLCQNSKLVIGGSQIDQISNIYLFAWEELSGQPGKRLQEMIFKDDSFANLVTLAQTTTNLYVPLPFWFTLTSGNALPVVSLQFHGIQLFVTFAQLQNCVQVSCVGQDAIVGSVAATGGPQVMKVSNSTPLVNSDLQAQVEANYVYLDIDERDRFATGSFEQLITQVQTLVYSGSQTQVRLQLNFNHPVIELIWMVRRGCQTDVNNQFVFAGANLQDPISTVELRLNNLPRLSVREGRYFRLVQPYQHHTNIPQNYIYVYSFALRPEDSQPSGSSNFSRIDNIEMILTMQSAITTAVSGGTSCVAGRVNSGVFEIDMFARSFNILRFREGLGGLAFSN